MLAPIRPAPSRFTTEPRPHNGEANLGSKSEATHGPPSAFMVRPFFTSAPGKRRVKLPRQFVGLFDESIDDKPVFFRIQTLLVEQQEWGKRGRL
jgi:hypothetical protein